MVLIDRFTEKWNNLRSRLQAGVNTSGSVYEKIKSVIGILVMVLYRLRKVFLAIPVVFYALRIADYNMSNLPDQVGFNLQTNGVFATNISREMAVMGPLGVTAACLVLMFVSKKALYPWAISLFTLALPVLILFSNLYPA